MDITDTLDINASVAAVWALTMDVENWPRITPTMTSVEIVGGNTVGHGVRARIKQPGMPAAVWTVTEFDPERMFVWETKVGTVRMRASHQLQRSGDGCRNTLSVELSGFGSGLMSRLLGRRILEAIATENKGFKTAAETGELPLS